MQQELETALEAYHIKWHTLVSGRGNKDFFTGLRPTAVGWKTVDEADFWARFMDLHKISVQSHTGWVDERWLATFYLREPLAQGVSLVKLMQRRPGSTDATGLDHLDFLIPKNSDTKKVLEVESELKWSEEFNGDHCKWISLWFDSTEAKLRSDTVLEVCANEMKTVERALLA
jgi:hypothetical protein